MEIQTDKWIHKANDVVGLEFDSLAMGSNTTVHHGTLQEIIAACGDQTFQVDLQELIIIHSLRTLCNILIDTLYISDYKAYLKSFNFLKNQQCSLCINSGCAY